MTATITRPTLNADLFNKYAAFIYDQTGIRFEESKNYFLASKASRRAEVLGLSDCAAYFDYITTHVDRRHELTKFIDVITIHETFFYRNEPQINSFERDILQPLITAKRISPNKKIRIWSAACSTGDEAYTIVLQFAKNGWLNTVDLEIVGTDISHQAVEDAKAAIYAEYAVRNIPPDLKTKYFKPNGDRQHTLADEIKQKVRFLPANLKERSEIRSLGRFDIVLCRNVLIYFDSHSKEQVLWNIYDAMDENSILLVGHSENLYGYKHIFKADKDLSNAFAYRKAPPGTEKLHI